MHKSGPMNGAFLRDMNWLGAARARGYLTLLAVMNVAMLVWLVAGSHGGVDANGFLLGSDFLSFWTTGRMLIAGANPYDIAAHIAEQRTTFAASDGYTAFFYPPSFLPFCWPLGLLPYFGGLAAWLGVTGAAWFAVGKAWARKAGLEGPVWLWALAFPAVPIVLTHGQTSFLVGALLGLGLLLVPGRPILAGMLIGIATIKPQFGLLVPVALVLTGQWRVIAAAALTAAALLGMSLLGFGTALFARWLELSHSAQAAMESGMVPFGKMSSLFAALRLFGLPAGAAYAAHVTLALAVAIAVAFACRRQGRWTCGTAALLLAGAPLVTPFVLDYDMVILAFPLLWLTGEALREGWLPWEKLAVAAAFVVPAFARPLALDLGVPVLPLVLTGLFLACLRRVALSPDQRQKD